MYTATCGAPLLWLISGTSSAVRKPMLQAPARGYSTITTLRKELDCDSTLSARLLTLPYTVRTTGMRFSSSSPQTISLRPIRFVTRSPVRSTTTSASTAPAPGDEPDRPAADRLGRGAAESH